MVEWIYTAALLGIVVIDILVLRYGNSLIALSWGILSLGIAAAAITESNVIFYPYMQFAVIFMGALTAFIGVHRARN